MAQQYGDVIKQLREDRSWSQTILCDKAQVSRDTLYRAEQSGNVGVLHLYQIANALDVEIGVFFGADKPVVKVQPPSVWKRLKREQRTNVLRYAYRLLGERVPAEEM